MHESRPRDAIVVGLGSPDRRDDAAGLEAVRLLAPLVPPDVRVAALPGRETELLDLWTGAPLAVVIDAVLSGAAPGTVHRLDGFIDALPGSPPHPSSHDLGLPDIVELGRALGRLPARLLILGIEAGTVAHGPGLSPPVRIGVERAVRIALAEVATARSPSPA
ncbi:MAG: hydrogenase maturation protease [Candidatus Palauibacterales bacterium]|nr:hydrogenase maturation protease [Candidatus Palauibacterales bacterium]